MNQYLDDCPFHTVLGLNTWLGLDDTRQEGRFVLPSSGQEPALTHWAPGQPDNFFFHEDCVIMDRNSGDWNDCPCTSSHPFLCEMNHG